MTKAQALLNFQAVTNYLMWKYTCPLYLEIKQKFNYFELEMHFEPEELQVESLKSELDEILESQTQMEFSGIEGYTAKCLTIRWNYNGSHEFFTR